MYSQVENEHIVERRGTVAVTHLVVQRQGDARVLDGVVCFPLNVHVQQVVRQEPQRNLALTRQGPQMNRVNHLETTIKKVVENQKKGEKHIHCFCTTFFIICRAQFSCLTAI